MILSKDLPTDSKYPKSCVYWIHREGVHTDPATSGYIGVCVRGAVHRFRQHTKSAKDGSSLIVHKAMRKYSDIVLTTLIEADPEFCLLFEEMLRPTAQIQGTWNIGAGGTQTMLGYKHTEEAKAKLAVANAGRVKEPDEIQKIRDAATGRKASSKTKAKMSAARLGKPKNLSPEQIKAKSDYMRTRPMSEETCQKISKSKTGKRFSEDTKARLKEVRAREYPDWLAYRATKSNWALASEMCEYLTNNPSHGIRLIAKHVSLQPGMVKTIFKKLKAGWIPSEDSAYMSWLTEYKEKECYGT